MLGLIAGSGGVAQRFPAGPGQHDDVTAPIVRIGVSLDQAPVLQRVNEPDHRGPVDTEPPSRLLLRCRFATAQHQQNREFAATDAIRTQCARRVLRELLLRVLQQIAEPIDQLGSRTRLGCAVIWRIVGHAITLQVR